MSESNKRRPYDCFAFYHQNEGLLFQFLLHTFLKIYVRLDHPHTPHLLQKLETYCQLEVLHFPKEKSIELLRSVKQATHYLLEESLGSVREEIENFRTLLFKQLPHYSADETVLFFLLRRKEEIDALFGAETLSSLLSKETSLNLVAQYKKRGFEYLIPRLESLLNHLPV